MDISGVLVRSFPSDVEAVSRALSQLAGVEVHGANGDGRMVVTVEADTGEQVADLLVRIQGISGVLSASMIYHQFEDSGLQEAE